MGNRTVLSPAVVGGGDYEAVAAGQTDQALGAVGSKGDFLARLLISVNTPATANVSIKDGSGSSIPLLTGAAALVPGLLAVEVGAYSTSGAWQVTTGAGATVVAVGNFV